MGRPWHGAFVAGVVLVLVLLALVPLAPVIVGGRFPKTHEFIRYEQLSLLFADAIRHGYAYPRWLPDLAGGLGYPTFVFYQPVVFYVAALCLQLPGVTSASVMHVVAFLFCLAGACGAYRLTRRLARRPVALACSALFVMTPIGFCNLHVRGDHSELAAMMLTPWPLAAVIAVGRRVVAGRPFLAQAIGGAVATALLIATHPVVSMIYVPLLASLAGLQAIAIGDRTHRRRWITTVVLLFVLAAALASPYWFSVWQNGGYVRLDRAVSGAFRPAEHVVDPGQLVSNRWSFGQSEPRSSGRASTMSLQLGLPHLALALVGAWLGRRRPWALACSVTYALLVAAMTPLAVPLWSIRSPLWFIQFPWRLLSVAAVFQVFLIALALRGRPAWWAWVGVVIAAAWYQSMFRISPHPLELGDGRQAHLGWRDAARLIDHSAHTVATSTETFALVNEFEPVWVGAVPSFRGAGPLLAARAAVLYRPISTQYQIEADVESPTADAVVIQQFYFPGWHVEVNGRAVPDDALRDNLTPDGRMIVAIPAGASRIAAHYDGPSGWRTRTAVFVLIGAAATLGLIRLNKRATVQSPVEVAHR